MLIAGEVVWVETHVVALTLRFLSAACARGSAAEPPDALELSVVHMLFVLALFPFCSADERNARQHHDMSGHLQK